MLKLIQNYFFIDCIKLLTHVNLILVSPFTICHSPICSSVSPSVFLSFTPGLKLSLAQILPPPVVSFPPPGLPLQLLRGPFFMSYLVFLFSPSLFFVCVPCARLSWPLHQLLSACRCTLLCRINIFIKVFKSTTYVGFLLVVFESRTTWYGYPCSFGNYVCVCVWL